MTCNICDNVGSPINPDIIVGTNGILVIGESPKGQLSDSLTSPTFKRLSNNLTEVDIDLFECSFTEICKCELKNRNNFRLVGHKCMPNLIQQIQTLKPKLIFTLGITTHEIFASALDIKPKVGEIVEINGYKYLPLWHTSPINPNSFKRNQEILLKYRHEL